MIQRHHPTLGLGGQFLGDYAEAAAQVQHTVLRCNCEGEALDLNVRPLVDPPRQSAAPDEDTADQVYSTFLGGGSEDVISAIAVDTTDQATVVSYLRWDLGGRRHAARF